MQYRKEYNMNANNYKVRKLATEQEKIYVVLEDSTYIGTVKMDGNLNLTTIDATVEKVLIDGKAFPIDYILHSIVATEIANALLEKHKLIPPPTL